MMKDLHIIKIFDPEYYHSGMAVRITGKEFEANGLIKDNEDEFLRIVIVEDSLDDSDHLTTNVGTMDVRVDEIESGDITIDFLAVPEIAEEKKEKESQTKSTSKLDLRAIYNAFLELSNSLCQEEHAVADSSGVDNQEEIDQRHDNRIKEFKKLFKDA